MIIVTMGMVGVLALASAGRCEPAVQLHVWNGHTVSLGTLARSQAMVTKMFAGIGVCIRWKAASVTAACSQTTMNIDVDFVSAAPDTASSDAFAQSFPYVNDRPKVVVFLNRSDRVLRSHPLVAAARLAHVLAHEITHILQGVNRHSEQGLMSGHWSKPEYEQMLRGFLRFGPDDIRMIQLGLASRKMSLMRPARP